MNVSKSQVKVLLQRAALITVFISCFYFLNLHLKCYLFIYLFIAYEVLEYIMKFTSRVWYEEFI
jgi:hypothetical protein